MRFSTAVLICLCGNLLCAGTAVSAAAVGAPAHAWVAWTLASYVFCFAGVLLHRRHRDRADD